MIDLFSIADRETSSDQFFPLNIEDFTLTRQVRLRERKHGEKLPDKKKHQQGVSATILVFTALVFQFSFPALNHKTKK